MSVVAALGLLLVALGPLLASWLLVAARRRATRRMWLALDEEVSAEPVPGHKTAQVLLSADGREALFTGVTLGRAYRAEDRAACPRPECQAPGLDCDCGFYAYRDRGPAVDLLGRRLLFNGLRSKALLTVEMSGRLLEYERGYRAEYQTVLRVEFSSRCAVCADAGLVTAATVLGVGSHPGSVPVASMPLAADHGLPRFTPPPYRPLRPVCAEHVGDRATITPATLAGLLGTEVLWLPPADEPAPWRHQDARANGSVRLRYHRGPPGWRLPGDAGRSIPRRRSGGDATP